MSKDLSLSSDAQLVDDFKSLLQVRLTTVKETSII